MSDFLNCAFDEPAASPALIDNQEFLVFEPTPTLPALSDNKHYRVGENGSYRGWGVGMKRLLKNNPMQSIFCLK